MSKVCIMRFSEPQRMCEQLLLFAVVFLFFGVPCFFHFFGAFFLCLFLVFVCFCQCFLFHCTFLVSVCFVVVSSPSLSSSRIHCARHLFCVWVASWIHCFMSDSIYDINDIYDDSTYVQASLWMCLIWPLHMRRLEWASENLRQQKKQYNVVSQRGLRMV